MIVTLPVPLYDCETAWGFSMIVNVPGASV